MPNLFAELRQSYDYFLFDGSVLSIFDIITMNAKSFCKMVTIFSQFFVWQMCFAFLGSGPEGDEVL